jgi:glc operon protein GlcG
MSAARTQTVITLEAARALVDRAIDEGIRAGVNVSVTVVDPGMGLVAFARTDGATPHSIDSSRRKANTAASTRRPTGWMGEDLALPLPLATDLQLTDIRGGAPLIVDAAVIGAVGVAGGTPEQDEQIATATVSR